jgi:hypothetical protein
MLWLKIIYSYWWPKWGIKEKSDVRTNKFSQSFNNTGKLMRGHYYIAPCENGEHARLANMETDENPFFGMHFGPNIMANLSIDHLLLLYTVPSSSLQVFNEDTKEMPWGAVKIGEHNMAQHYRPAISSCNLQPDCGSSSNRPTKHPWLRC